MGIILKEEQKGFTIVEVMLFLALSGFLLAGIMLGTGSSIANQRYNDSVQDAVDAIRSAYSFVADTQVSERENGLCGNTIGDAGISSARRKDNSGRGRSSCAVYGAVVTLGKNDAGDTTIQTTTLIGRDYRDFINDANSGISDADREKARKASTSDLELLRILQANNIAAECTSDGDCTIAPAGSVSTRKLKWEAVLKKRNAPPKKNEDLNMTLLIYRSPRTGVIRTLVMDDVIKDDSHKRVDYVKDNLTDLEAQGVYKYLKDSSSFKQKDIYVCIESNGMTAFSNHSRAIRIVKNAHSQTGINLLDMDNMVDQNGDEVLCDK